MTIYVESISLYFFLLYASPSTTNKTKYWRKKLNTELNHLFDDFFELIIKLYLEAVLCWSCWIKAEPRFMDFPREFKIQPPPNNKTK